VHGNADILARWPRSVAAQEWLDPLARRVTGLGDMLKRMPTLDAIARGSWLGHPVHPALTDLPIGCWTSAMLVDLVGGPAADETARRLIACGNVAVVPTAIAGLADARDRATPDRRVASVHAALNGAGVFAYLLSSIARRSGRRRLGITTSFVGATFLTAAAHLGGHLVFGSRDADHAAAHERGVPIRASLERHAPFRAL
jgi:hypothetical protein